jgi:hypothetical protein
MNMSCRSLGFAAGVALAVAALPASALAAAKSTAYFAFADGARTAYLIDWLPKARARVAARLGARTGTIAEDGGQKTISFDTPMSYTYEDVDACGLPIEKRYEFRQLIVRNLPAGVTQFVQLGAQVNVGGCQDGLTEPFGSPSDTGESLKRVAMSDRPPMTDMVPGVQIAGFSEEASQQPPGYVAEDVVTLSDGSASFQRTGSVVPATLGANGWLVFSFPDFQRAYTRLAVDTKTAGETWLLADWADSLPQRVEEVLVVKPVAGAGFGSVAQASRMWESGLFQNSVVLRSATHLYKSGTGERVTQYLDQDIESRDPIQSWGFAGVNLMQHRSTDDGWVVHTRTWVPLRNQGSKVRWVMENETRLFDGQPIPGIKPRVNFYIDTGKAVPPAQRVVSGTDADAVRRNARPDHRR